MFSPDVETAPPSGAGSVSNSFYEVAGRRLAVAVDAGWAARFVSAFFRGFHVRPARSADPHAPADLRLTVSATDPAGAPPAALREFPVPGGLCRADSVRYFLDVSGGRVEVAPRAEGRVSVWLGQTPPAGQRRRKNALITVMAYAVPAALRRCGLYDLHAAGMVEPASGAAFLFPGASGSGKTSLALRLAAAGWRYMSDDLVAVNAGAGESGGEVEARPLRRPFQTDAASLAGCDLPRLEEALGPPIPNDPEKRKLDPSILFPGRLASVATPRVLCFPSVAADEASSRVEPLSQAEAMTRLVRMCPWSSYDLSAAREHLRLLARLSRQCRAYTLAAGRDLFDAPARAAELLAPLA